MTKEKKTVTNWEIKIDEKNLDTFIDNLKACGAKKFSIISVLGAFRTGKSFILDLMLRRLQTQEKWLEGKIEGESQHYFTYRHQEERVTTGCWVYSRPYVVNGIAMVLMDTQGLFDLKTPMKINQAVFCLSTLISSYQILNIQNQLAENDLGNLEFFTNFARSAIEINNETAECAVDLDTFKFQRMEILVRDYLHYDEDNTDFSTCKEKMKEFLKTTFHFNNNHDAGTRARILEMFEEVTCFGLPHPGKCVTKKRWDGNLSQLDKEFVKIAQDYFDHIFSQDPVVKRALFPGEEMSPDLLKIYITNFAEVFRSGELPEAVSVSHAFAKCIHLSAKENALSEYENKMREFTNTTAYFEPNELEKIHETALEDALGLYEAKSKYGQNEDRQVIRTEFQQRVDRLYGEYKKLNKARISEMLSWLAPFVLVAVIAWVVDKMTDWTCDGVIAECDKLSFVAVWVYTLVPLAIAGFSYDIYNKKGTTTMYRSLSGLVSEVATQGTDYYYKVFGHNRTKKSKKD